MCTSTEWFEENIGMAVRRLCERISGYRGRSEKDGVSRSLGGF
jgi:hypothetical protein